MVGRRPLLRGGGCRQRRSVLHSGRSVWAVACGVAFNHPVDTLVTLPLIEGRMLRRPDRAALYKAYQKRTPQIVPWFVREAKVD